MKKFINVTLLFLILIAIYIYRIDIYNFYYDYLVPAENKISKLENNKYYREYNFNYVKNTTNFMPKNKQDILNIYYTVINSGMDSFAFYCPNTYLNCQKDINDIANDQTILSNINNFVHPYNSFKSIQTGISSSGEINLTIEKVYTEKMIYLIDYEIEKIINKEITSSMSQKEKVKKIHDYIINNTKYDQDRSDNKITNYSSDNAFGVLTENYGVCGGYTDTMMLFLEKFDIKSIRVSSENHIWNYVYLDDEWLHLDLTWDDPISTDDDNILDDTYFLISTDELEEIKSEEHYFDIEIYE